MKEESLVFFEDRDQWRRWLEQNHDKASAIFLVHYKKHTKKPGVEYNDAVEEAICFGWIDGKLKRIDEEKFMLRYSPRQPKSRWSQANKTRAEKMIKEGKMTPAGHQAIALAKESGAWEKAYQVRRQPSIPKDLRVALKAYPEAWQNFQQLSNSHQNAYVIWVAEAKKPETRKRRIHEIVERSRRNIKPTIDTPSYITKLKS